MTNLRDIVKSRQLATPRQREYMDEHDIDFTEKTTKEEASLFISQYIDEMSEGSYQSDERDWHWKR